MENIKNEIKTLTQLEKENSELKKAHDEMVTISKDFQNLLRDCEVEIIMLRKDNKNLNERHTETKKKLDVAIEALEKEVNYRDGNYVNDETKIALQKFRNKNE